MKRISLTLLTAIFSTILSENTMASITLNGITYTNPNLAISETNPNELYGSACGGKCTVYYDTQTGNTRIIKNSNVAENEEVKLSSRIENIFTTSSGPSLVHFTNVTIGEGITGSQYWGLSTYGGTVTGCADCTLSLPSTFQSSSDLSVNSNIFWNISFGTIDASALKNTALNLESGALKNLILSEDANVNIKISPAYGNYPSNLTVQCKGSDLDTCTNQISLGKDGSGKTLKTTIKGEYYKGYDEKGRLTEEWSADGKKTYTYKTDANGDYKIYDGNGNFLGSFMADGSKRRIYQVDEATAVAKGNKNTFSIRYR